MTIINAYFKIFDDFNIYTKISIQIFLIIFFTFIISKLIKYTLFLAFKYFAKSKSNLDNSIIVAIKKPILFFFWLYAFLICSDLIIEKLDENFLKLTITLKIFIVFLFVLVFLFRSITQIKKHYIIQKEKFGIIIDYSGIDAIDKLSKVAVSIIWLILFLGKMGFNLNALVAFGGAGGVIVGFAGKDLFANIFGGLIIYLDKPFSLGDWIASPDKDIEGDVEFIGWRQTRILTFEKFPIYVPNSIFGTIVIQNKSRLRSRRINENISIRYTDIDKINKITSDILTMLKEHPGINKKYTMYTNIGDFNNGMITLTIYTFTNTTELVRFREIKQDVLLKVIEIIKLNGAELGFSPTSVYMKDSIEKKDEKIIDFTNS